LQRRVYTCFPIVGILIEIIYRHRVIVETVLGCKSHPVAIIVKLQPAIAFRMNQIPIVLIV
jgi:hypothetical protein